MKNEARRVQVLRGLNILDTSQSSNFDAITQLTAQALNIPYCIISLIDEDHIWYKSAYGCETGKSQREEGLCGGTIQSDDVYVIEDASKNEACKNHSLVKGKFGLRFYAGVPLSIDGENVGALCVFDQSVGRLTEEQQKMLKGFGKVVEEQMMAHKTTMEALKAEKELGHMLNVVYENTSEACAFIDTDFKLCFANRIVQEMSLKIVGKKIGLGDNMLDLFTGKEKREFETYYNRVLKGETIVLEKQRIGFWFRIKLYPIYNEQQEIVGIAHNSKNVTKRKKNELKVIRQYKRLKAVAWRQSHLVRKPLVNIIGLIQLLERESPYVNKDQREIVDMLLKSTSELDKIIHEIVDTSISKDSVKIDYQTEASMFNIPSYISSITGQ